MAKGQEPNEFLRYSGGGLGPQLRTFEETPSLFEVILDHFIPTWRTTLKHTDQTR